MADLEKVEGNPLSVLGESSTQVSTEPSTSWLDGLGEDLKQDTYAMKQLAKFKDIEELGRSYVNANKLIGKRVQELPREELRNLLGDELGEIYTKQGIPASPEDYANEYLDKLNSPDLKRTVAVKAHSLGLSNESLTELLKFNEKVSTEVYSAQREEWRTDVQQKYGKEFPKAIAQARQAVLEFGGQELSAYLDKTGLGDNPTIVDMFVKVGKAMAEDTVPGGFRSSRGSSKDALQKEIVTLRNDPKFMKPYREGKKENVDKLMGLYQRMQELDS